MRLSKVRGTPRLGLLARTTTPPILSDETELTRLILVDYFEAPEPTFRMYLRI